jgi:hypothetical protein
MSTTGGFAQRSLELDFIDYALSVSSANLAESDRLRARHDALPRRRSRKRQQLRHQNWKLLARNRKVLDRIADVRLRRTWKPHYMTLEDL